MKRFCLSILTFWAAAAFSQDNLTSSPTAADSAAANGTVIPAPGGLPWREAKPWDAFFLTIRPFVEQHCQVCHNGTVTSGGINFEVLKFSQSLEAQADTWEKMSYVLKMDQMPPQGMPRPLKEDSAKVVAFLDAELAKLTQSAEKEAPPTPEWLTWQGNPERTGWAEAETGLTKANAKKLKVLWRTQLDINPKPRRNGALSTTVSAPLVAEGIKTAAGSKKVVYVADGENNIYALDGVTGTVIWMRRFPNNAIPPSSANLGCPNNLNATPVIDKENNTLYVLTNDGLLRGLSLSDGTEVMAGQEFVKAFSRNWSLNLVDGMIYTSSSRGCGGSISNIVAIDVRDLKHPVKVFYPSTGKASGPWGRGGIVKSSVGMLAQTADGAYDPAGGRFGNSLLGFTRDLRLNDSFTPKNWDYLNSKDFDLGATSPISFKMKGRTIIATGAKEGLIYLLDASNLGGADHMTPLYTSPRYGNDAEVFSFNGIWGSLSTFVDDKGRRILLVPMLGPPAAATKGEFKYQYGKVVNGTVMAFEVTIADKGANKGQLGLQPLWMTHDLDAPGIPIAANGVVYVLGTGDRGSGFGLFPPGMKPPRVLFVGRPPNEVNVGEPGADKDAAWLESQSKADGQSPGDRYKGGMDRTNAVLYAFDAETGKELYSSDNLIPSYNHYGAIALAGGVIYVSTHDGRVYGFGVKK